ncbi:MAG: hypothetical protein SGJ27_05645 [Candidatus Melainabacteria bacterium]|nr:hypothetical protein [Candidatus Melainabacteria bacterium]
MMHAFASRHFLNMLGYFVGASALILLFDSSISAAGFLSGAAAAVIIGFVGLVVGLGVTIVLRSVFGLMQTGRFIQYLCFFLGTTLGVSLASFAVSSLVVPSVWAAGLLIFAIAFGAATWTGEVPVKGRTWLPRRMPNRG